MSFSSERIICGISRRAWFRLETPGGTLLVVFSLLGQSFAHEISVFTPPSDLPVGEMEVGGQRTGATSDHEILCIDGATSGVLARSALEMW